MEFSTTKSCVVPFNWSERIPNRWQFGDEHLLTTSAEKYLSVKFTSNASWSPHFNAKLGHANTELRKLTRAGLLGGHHPVQQSCTVAKSKLWPILDSGRIATSALHLDSDAKAIALRLNTFVLKVGMLILGLSPRAVSDGVLGELGWCSDSDRERKVILVSLSRCLATPAQSIVSTLIMGALASLDPPPFIEKAKYLIRLLGLSEAHVYSQKWRVSAKRAVRRAASVSWTKRVAMQPRLSLAYPSSPSLVMRGYLKLPPFRGRQLLTKLRLDDLALSYVKHRSTRGAPVPNCSTCGLEPETRLHFTMVCPNLEYVRDQYRSSIPALSDETMSLEVRLRHIAQSAQGSLAPAHVVGSMLADLWYARYAPFSPLAIGGPLYLPKS